MKKIFLALGLLAHTLPALAGGETVLWQAIPKPGAEPLIQATRYRTFRADPAAIRALLRPAGETPQAAVGLNLPLPDGTVAWFQVWETPISTPDFYAKYPEMRTYTGVQKGKPLTTVKLDVNPDGFHAQILAPEGQYYIDPFNRQTTDTYLVYDKADLSRQGRQGMVCEVADERPAPPEPADPSGLLSNGLNLRTFRLALACTGEYAVAATGLANPTKADVLAKMVTSINRINGVYEKELAMRFQLIPNTDTLIYFDGNTDPYTNNSGSAMLGENQAVVTARIGTANYDIGHVFSTGGGGIAQAGSLCSSFGKARGVTGSPSPVGDGFDIDYVAHEIGHQCNAHHTFNANTGSCAGNGSPSNAYEPGSGSTIMAYANICGPLDNLQRNSDAYFHTRSLDVISTHVSNNPTCGTTVPTGNVVPVVPALPAVHTIPWLTPFELEAPQPTNAGTAFTYCWEQYDLGNFGASYSNTAATGPIIRSFPPEPSRVRYIPNPSRYLRNLVGTLGDRLPLVSRTMNFRLTVRDVNNGLGTFTIVPNGQIQVNTVVTPDTFRVINFNNGLDTFQAGSTHTLLWNVANTTDTPFSCPTVDIYFSADSGRTWPHLLAAGVPNSGSASITLPPFNTNRARLRVKAGNNIFYAINRVVFRVVGGWPLGMEEVEDAWGAIVLYPVPAREQLFVDLPAGLGTVAGRVVNVMGQTLWQGALQQGKNTIGLAGLPAGTYYLRMQNAEKGFQKTSPFVVR